jgi:hypothetical protein
LMSLRRRSRAIFFVLTGAVLVAVAGSSMGGCGDDNALVGGSCAVPFTECSLQCVDLQTDPGNCGACGNVCQPGEACVSGQCNGTRDGTIGDGSHDGTTDALNDRGPDDDAPGDERGLSDVLSDDGGADGQIVDGGRDDALADDGSFGDGATRDGSSGDGSSGDGASGDGASGDGGEGGEGGIVCVPPFDTNQQCGDCFTRCAFPNDTCKPADGGFACQPFCDPGFTNCGGVCFDLQNDGQHCGTCTNVCPSLLCRNALCRGGINGDLAVIGHDYATSVPFPGPQSTVLTNAVFLRTANPLRVLAYQRYASPQSVSRVTTLLQSFATASGRTLQMSPTSVDTDIPTRLTITGFEALLVYDEQTAGPGVLGPLGASWQSTLATYLAAGGVVVVLDGAAGAIQEMPQLLSAAGLLSITMQNAVAPGTQVNNVAPGDSIGKNVGTFYAATKSSARFVTEAPSATVTYVVMEPVSGQPVVVHKTF